MMNMKIMTGMRRGAGLLLAAVLTAGFGAAGCAKAEDAAPAAALLSLGGAVKAASEPAAASTVRLADIGAPERFTTSFTDAAGNIVVTADAEVTLPNAETVPVATVTRARFTQETADKLIGLLCGDGALYAWDGHTDRRFVSRMKIRITELRAMKNGEIPQSFDSGEKTPEELDAQIAEIEARIERHKDMASSPADMKFRATDIEGQQAVRVQTAVGGEPAYLSIENNNPLFSHSDSAVFRHDRVSDFYFADGGALRDTQKEDAEAALRTADTFMSELGLDDFAPGETVPGVLRDHGVYKDNYVRPVNEDGTGIYVVKPEDLQFEPDVPVIKLEYVRQINGVPVTYTSVDNYSVPGGGDGTPPDSVDEMPWLYERITFYMESGDIIGFDWVSPYSEPKIVTADARLLLFEDIAAIFEKMLPVTQAWVARANAVNESFNQYTVKINSVKLGLMRVRTPGGAAADGDTETGGTGDSAYTFNGVLVPVWDFIGDDRFANSMGENRPILTVNALDGTVVDRATGY